MVVKAGKSDVTALAGYIHAGIDLNVEEMPTRIGSTLRTNLENGFLPASAASPCPASKTHPGGPPEPLRMTHCYIPMYRYGTFISVSQKNRFNLNNAGQPKDLVCVASTSTHKTAPVDYGGGWFETGRLHRSTPTSCEERPISPRAEESHS